MSDIGKEKDMAENDAAQINEAYDSMAQAQKVLYLHTEAAINAKADVDTKLLKGLADGSIEGKNQAMRDACAAEVLEKEYRSLDIAEADARAARLEYDLAKTEVSRVQALLRLRELSSD